MYLSRYSPVIVAALLALLPALIFIFTPLCGAPSSAPMPAPTPTVPTATPPASALDSETTAANIEQTIAALISTFIPTPTPTAGLDSVAPTPTLTPPPPPQVFGLAAMISQVKPSIVRINVTQQVKRDAGFPAGGVDGSDAATAADLDIIRGVATGFIIEVREGATWEESKALVLTNYHNVADAIRIDVQVNTDDGHTYRGRVIGFEERRDLAVLEICCGQFRALKFGSAADISIGSEVVAVGYALGYAGDATVTRGIVSGLRFDADLNSWVVQTDASINPGNSGGPLFLPDGRVIGMVTSIPNPEELGVATTGLGFAISQETINERLHPLIGGDKFLRLSPHIPLRWQTIRNPDHNYIIDVPEDWSAGATAADARQIRFESPDGHAGAAVSAPEGPVGAMDEWVDTAISGHVRHYEEALEPLVRETVTYANGDSWTYLAFQGKAPSDACSWSVTELYVRSSHEHLVASFHTPTNNTPRYACPSSPACR